MAARVVAYDVVKYEVIVWALAAHPGVIIPAIPDPDVEPLTGALDDEAVPDLRPGLHDRVGEASGLLQARVVQVQTEVAASGVADDEVRLQPSYTRVPRLSLSQS